MKVKPKIYAEALAEMMISAKGPDVAENFVKLLEKNRDLGKIKEILALAEKIFAEKTGRRKIVVETARKMDSKQREMVHSVAHQGDIISEKINPDLIAGIKIIINDLQLDLSMQKKLQNIFK